MWNQIEVIWWSLAGVDVEAVSDHLHRERLSRDQPLTVRSSAAAVC